MMRPINADVDFNPAPATFMHVDINSCFATVEQQANPTLRGKSVAVAASNTSYGCVLAASVEAKKVGVKTGMRVREAKFLCPSLVVLEPDPDKYRFVHKKLRRVLERYSDSVLPKSIDEFSVDMKGCLTDTHEGVWQSIRKAVFADVGEWITVSVGFGPNRFLAKTAAGVYKPDGMAVIDIHTVESILSRLSLTDLCGISYGNSARLIKQGITSPLDFYRAPLFTLKAAFRSIVAYYWYMHLRGFELPLVAGGRSSLSNSYVLAKPAPSIAAARPVITKLIDKLTRRLRKQGFAAGSISIRLLFADHSDWHATQTLETPLFTGAEMYERLERDMIHAPQHKEVKQVMVACFNLTRTGRQLDLFGRVIRNERLAHALDSVSERWGEYVLMPARMLPARNMVPDSIAFGRTDA